MKNHKLTIDYVLTRGVEGIIPSKKDLANLMSKRKITLYQGFDTTSPSLHIGHMVGIRKLAHFQKLGHKIIFLVGDFTGMIGDPTDKSAARQKLTRKESLINLKGFKNQVKNIIDFQGKNPAKILFNYDWLSKLTFEDIIDLAANFTVQQMLERDFFQTRLKEKKPIHLHEFLYPLMQGYDSVHMNVDLEVAGYDQLFNMMAGRTLLKAYKNKEKFNLTHKLLVDPTGTKMGKTEGNTANLTDAPENIYGKIMAFPDQTLKLGFEVYTDLLLSQIDFNNPMKAKKLLALEIVKQIHGKTKAQTAQTHFEKVFQNRELPTKIPSFPLTKLPQTINIIDLLEKTQLVSSRSQAKRLIEQAGVKLNQQKITQISAKIALKINDILQVGKRRFIKFK